MDPSLRWDDVILCLTLIFIGIPSIAQTPARPNAFVQYDVAFSADPAASIPVTLTFSGANEIGSVRLSTPPHMHLHAHTGTFTPAAHDGVRWTLGGLDGSVRYTIDLPHERSPQRYDSYHAGDWLITRTSDLFPSKGYVTTAPLALHSQLRVQLPATWRIASAMPPAPGASDAVPRFDAPARRSPITTPYGWIMAGALDISEQQIQQTHVVIAAPRRAGIAHDPYWQVLRAVLPAMQRVTQRMPMRLLIALPPDPFWRGGLSGEDSLALHADLPLIASDHTSTLVHELLHICQRTRKDNPSADWIVEGLAEYYSLKLLRASRVITPQQFARGVGAFAKHAAWHKNFATSTAHNVLYEAAPLVFFAIDREIAAATNGQRSLDNVVTRLFADTAFSQHTLLAHLTYIAPDIDWTAWLTRHTQRAEMPAWEQWLE